MSGRLLWLIPLFILGRVLLFLIEEVASSAFLAGYSEMLDRIIAYVNGG